MVPRPRCASAKPASPRHPRPCLTSRPPPIGVMQRRLRPPSCASGGWKSVGCTCLLVTAIAVGSRQQSSPTMGRFEEQPPVAHPRDGESCILYLVSCIATYSPTTPPAVDAIATGSCRMTPSMMSDSGDPVPTSSGFAITRRGGPGDVAATRAAGEEGCRVRAFEDADAAPRAPHCARIITSHQKNEPAPPYAHGDSHRPHCKSVTVAQLPGQRVHGSSPHCTRRVSGHDFDTIHASCCTHVTTGDSLEVYGAAGSGMSRFK